MAARPEKGKWRVSPRRATDRPTSKSQYARPGAIFSFPTARCPEFSASLVLRILSQIVAAVGRFKDLLRDLNAENALDTCSVGAAAVIKVGCETVAT